MRRSLGTETLTATDVTNGFVDITLGTAMTEGANALTASSTMAGGSSAGLSVTLDTIVAAPQVTSVTAAGDVGGTAEAGAEVNIDGTTVTADGSGNWTYSFGSFAASESFAVSQVDVAGNTSGDFNVEYRQFDEDSGTSPITIASGAFTISSFGGLTGGIGSLAFND